MKVAITMETGSKFWAVLKLYDRRFGMHRREIRGAHVPLTAADEAAFQSFVRDGKMAPFLGMLEHDKKTEEIVPGPSHYYDSTPEGRARFEAALWQDCQDHFECETEAYARLQDLQGRLIPRMHAHVRIAPDDSEVPADLLLSPQTAPYFEIRGVLLEAIDGYTLWDIVTSPRAPADPSTWLAIIEAAADAAHEINKCGVLMEDCAPRNVVVDASTKKPFIIDLAQCQFRDKLVQDWLEWGWAEDDEEWDPNVEYWEWVTQRGNPGAIGAVMMTRLLREKGLRMAVELPDHEEMLRKLKESKARGGPATVTTVKKKYPCLAR
jgi:hypothetical protein